LVPEHQQTASIASEGEPLHAVVKNGRLELDEPTPLPEGQVFELVPVEKPIDDATDDLDDEERAELHESLRESIEQMKNGEGIGMAEALAELRAHR
jgi:hypothetical protein